MVLSAIAGIFILAIVGGIGLGVSSANANDGSPDTGFIVLGAPSHVQATDGQQATENSEEPMEYYERSTLAYTSTRTLDAGMKMLDDRDRAEQERRAREDAGIVDRVAAQKAMQGVESTIVQEPATTEAAVDEPMPTAHSESPDDGDAVGEAPEEGAPIELTVEGQSEYGLPAVDWTIGRDAFVREWGARIDAYLAGSQLDGYGTVFAEAAWENGVDPRWSPAISNTESGKGTACFLPHNAWGWGSSSWPDWETAIRDHVAGLASGYGYSLTLEAAGMYCPPNQQGWYETTLNEMSLI